MPLYERKAGKEKRISSEKKWRINDRISGEKQLKFSSWFTTLFKGNSAEN